MPSLEREKTMTKKILLVAFFLGAFFSTISSFKMPLTNEAPQKSVVHYQWGAGLDVAHARGK